MADKDRKPGFLRRLFGAGATKTPEPTPEEARPAQAKPPAKPKTTSRQAPASKPKPPATTGKPKAKPAKAAAGKTTTGKAGTAKSGGKAPRQPSPKRARTPKPAHTPATDTAKVIPFPRPAPRVVPPEPKPAPAPTEAKPLPPPSPPRETPSNPAPEPGAPKPKGWLARLTGGLARTSAALGDNIQAIFTKRKLDEATLQDLEDALVQADLGLDMASRITEKIAKGRYEKEIAPEEVRGVLAEEVAKVLAPVAKPLVIDASRRPHVILVVGVNGSGKTTTIGKLAHRFADEGKRVVLAAGDTFRAAAIDQLKIWGERTGAEVMARAVGADAAGLAFEALEHARKVQADVLMIDTAGRLQNKADLMAELAKVVRVLKKLDDSAPHSVLLVLDATTGQNAIAQAEVFRDIAGVTGIVMTKLDGTARGGILVAIAERFGLPVHAIGVGEGIDDLQPFEAPAFAAAIAGQQSQRPPR